MNPPRIAIVGAGLLLAAAAQAGRPLASDDAGTADAGTCQLEAWAEKARAERATVLAPACGLVPGLELGADFTQPRPRDTVRAEGGLAVKLAPESWKLGSGDGAVRLGLKAGASWLKPTGAGWQASGDSLLGLASWPLGESFELHLNLGVGRDRASGTRAGLANVALVWTPAEPVLLFAEAQANSKRDTFGATVASVGARWWLVPDKLGLDLSASREATSGAVTLWTLGLGWYGIGF